MKLGSLFDGSGTCPLAASAVGIIPAWASEIEPFPKAVTQSRFPKMVHLGDITKMNGAEIEPVDVITFGSPCQNYAEFGITRTSRLPGMVRVLLVRSLLYSLKQSELFRK